VLAGTHTKIVQLSNIEHLVVKKLYSSDHVNKLFRNHIDLIVYFLYRMKLISANSSSGLSFTTTKLDQSDRNSIFGPYSCADSSQDENFRSTNPGYPAYSKGNCMLAERQRQAVAWLNCSLIYYPRVAGTRYCSPMENTYMFINERLLGKFLIQAL
jgi:hypothetical protein